MLPQHCGLSITNEMDAGDEQMPQVPFLRQFPFLYVQATHDHQHLKEHTSLD